MYQVRINYENKESKIIEENGRSYQQMKYQYDVAKSQKTDDVTSIELVKIDEAGKETVRYNKVYKEKEESTRDIIDNLLNQINSIEEAKKYAEGRFNILQKELNDLSHTMVNIATGRMEVTDEEKMELFNKQMELERENRLYKEKKKEFKSILYAISDARKNLNNLKIDLDNKDKKVSGYNMECKTIEYKPYATEKEKNKIVNMYKNNSFFNKVVIDNKKKIVTAYRKLLATNKRTIIENIY